MRSRVVRRAVDALAAVLLAVGAGGNLAAGAWPLPGWMTPWLGWAIMGLSVVPLLIRWSWPMPAFAAGLVMILVSAPIGGPIVGVPLAATGCALYVLAAYGPQRTSMVALVVAGIEVVLVSVLIPSPAQPATLSLGISALGVSYALGYTVLARREHAAQLRETYAHQAVSEERLRIAREMHDVVAHSMSLIAVKAGVGNHVALDQPEEARDALRVIEDTSRETLAELRRMLGVLRGGTGEPEALLAPAPTLADLRALVERAGQAGPSVELDVEDLPELPGGIGQSVYRIAQEALTNVVKHAGASTCRVLVRGGEGQVSIEVTDDGAANGPVVPGHGLIGMRERVAVYGGEFSAEPLPDKGFRVFARLPYDVAEVSG
ncbi:sensor histidine kinase [Amycolatopsis sp. NPDC059027]|uniref:sensor histidine kinase n=1 Tax=unclassified Amycolatopsis TaxID=2618356 RepID=UPI00366D3C32